MTHATDRQGHLTLNGPLPTGWSIEGTADLIFAGPRGIDGTPARIRVTVEPEQESVEAVSLRLMREIQLTRPEALVVNCELWPHVQWGDGRYIQSACFEAGTTIAHDIYLFAHGGRSIRIEVDCELTQLLAIEEAVATIVARLRGREVTS